VAFSAANEYVGNVKKLAAPGTTPCSAHTEGSVNIIGAAPTEKPLIPLQESAAF
jgi:hypothetical protein